MRWRGFFADIGRRTVRGYKRLLVALDKVGSYSTMCVQTLGEAVRPPFEWRETLRQMDHLGVKSLSIVGITALFVGMVLALQSATQLARFGAKIYVGKMVAVALVLELGPVITALVVCGRVGAGIAAELGSMTVTEQVDALRAMGCSPIKKLVVPRVVTMFVMLPLLTAVADFLGIALGGLFVSVTQLRLSGTFYVTSVLRSLTMLDLANGLSKSFVFGLLISTIGCYNGLNTYGGTEGVGTSTRVTVVVASLAILISDFFMTMIWFWFY